MKKVMILTSMLCTYSALHAEKAKKVPMEQRTKTTSGLEYTILKPGTESVMPQVGSHVTVHYTGWLNDNGKPGKQFDSSISRGQPFKFRIGIGQVIRGWDEGVMNMQVGEKRRLYIPAALGYGARGAGAAIPPHADLIFDVELLDVSK